ncbi:hypothetical protein DSO57_1019472 [Entomophthora muscae]|uniref:Uncharacterized protein n=1 Tax=Entomophthora muscae TaxID=34485 RepID=A0ACC2SGU0_9FUNG|nr:hypothetical protein DSO57_1019472 [Entomophthora muscae]
MHELLMPGHDFVVNSLIPPTCNPHYLVETIPKNEEEKRRWKKYLCVYQKYLVTQLRASHPSTEYFLTETEATSEAGTLNLQSFGLENLVTDSSGSLCPSGLHVFFEADSWAGHTSAAGAISKSLQLEDLLGSGVIHSPQDLLLQAKLPFEGAPPELAPEGNVHSTSFSPFKFLAILDILVEFLFLAMQYQPLVDLRKRFLVGEGGSQGRDLVQLRQSFAAAVRELSCSQVDVGQILSLEIERSFSFAGVVLKCWSLPLPVSPGYSDRDCKASRPNIAARACYVCLQKNDQSQYLPAMCMLGVLLLSPLDKYPRLQLHIFLCCWNTLGRKYAN